MDMGNIIVKTWRQGKGMGRGWEEKGKRGKREISIILTKYIYK